MSTDSATLARLLALGGELHSRRKFDLAHMRLLLQELGNPQQRFPSVLIAGTNGKGSTACTLASILQACGYRTGLYTSPHLETPNERIRIDSTPVSSAELASLFVQVEASASRLVATGTLPHTPSFFETMTAMAFLAFAGRSVAIAILEVGLGGRLDATNVVEPILSILTDIALDHKEWLGDTIGAITREKAGILRAGGTLVTLPQHPEANQVIGEVAVPLATNAINAADYLPARTLASMPVTQGALAGLLRNQYQVTLPPDVCGGAVLHIDSPLAGSHQQRNLALAIAAAVQLQRDHGFQLDVASMERGIQSITWPGRLQLVEKDGSAPVLLDAAHNPAGAWALRAALSPLPVSGPRTLIFGCMADKEIAELAQILFPVFDRVILTEINTPRSALAQAIEPAAQSVGANYQLFSKVADAMDTAQGTTPQDGLIVVAGSVALVGECLSILASQTGTLPV